MKHKPKYEYEPIPDLPLPLYDMKTEKETNFIDNSEKCNTQSSNNHSDEKHGRIESIIEVMNKKDSNVHNNGTIIQPNVLPSKIPTKLRRQDVKIGNNSNIPLNYVAQPLCSFGRNPIYLQCPVCGYVNITQVDLECGPKLIFCVILLFFLAACFSLLLLTMSALKRPVHTCRKCHTILGVGDEC